MKSSNYIIFVCPFGAPTGAKQLLKCLPGVRKQKNGGARGRSASPMGPGAPKARLPLAHIATGTLSKLQIPPEHKPIYKIVRSTGRERTNSQHRPLSEHLFRGLVAADGKHAGAVEEERRADGVEHGGKLGQRQLQLDEAARLDAGRGLSKDLSSNRKLSANYYNYSRA